MENRNDSTSSSRFKRIVYFISIIGFTAHLSFAVQFLIIGSNDLLVQFNLFFSVPCFLLAFFLNYKNRSNLAFAIAGTELLLHQILAIYLLGWENGYQYYLIYLALLPGFNPNWGKHIRIGIASVALIAFALLYLLTSTPSSPNFLGESGFLLTSLTASILIFILVNYSVEMANRNEQTLSSMVKERTKDLLESQNSAISMLAEAGHYNDADTGVHIHRMASYSSALARKLNWSEKEALLLEKAAKMHDTGKIGIPDAILKKPAKLTPEEWTVMKTHSDIGFSILSRSETPLFQMASKIAYSHHEKWDGSGYPNGIKGEEIPESARIVAIADVYDALTMERPYKKAWSEEDAFKEIEKGANSSFDPAMVEAFLEIKQQLKEIRERFSKSSDSHLSVD